MKGGTTPGFAQPCPPDARMNLRYAMHPVSQDELVTCQSMLGQQDQTARLTLMPTHHINDLGDMMGFRFSCNLYSTGNILPLVRTMFHGHTLVECPNVSEAQIMQLMSEPDKNRETMLEFLRETEETCIPATLDCVPENASVVTQHGTIQAGGLLTVDSQHWTPEVPERIGIYHAYIRGFNRDVRTHRLFLVCSGGLYKASDAFCNMVIDVGRSWTAQASNRYNGGGGACGRGLTIRCFLAGRVRLAGGVVAAEGVPALEAAADQGAGGQVRHQDPVRAGKLI